MALFTDGPISSMEDLRGHDTKIAEVANIEGIDVTRKLWLAQEEVEVELTALLGKQQLGIAGVVVTAPLKLWHTYRALEMVYRDAYHSQLNDRYAGRRDEYGEMAKWAREHVIQSGLGMSADPLRKADPPAVRAVSGSFTDGTYYAGVAWVNAAGEEGACSNPSAIAVAGNTVEVRHGAAPANATGWHVYLGTGPTAMVRQNSAPLALGAPWTASGAPAAGNPAGDGQAPEYLQPLWRLLERG